MVNLKSYTQRTEPLPIFEQAEIDKELCTLAGDRIKNKSKQPIGEYEILDFRIDSTTNFKGIVYKKDNEIIICCLGTEALSPKDHKANLETAFTNKPSKQMQKAENFYENIKNNYPNSAIRFIGHSEGGAEVTYLGLKYGHPVTTFNAYGIGAGLINEINGAGNINLITNFRDPHDPISKLRELPGANYVVPGNQNAVMAKTPFGSVQAHRIANLGDCANAIEIEEYKKLDPLFIDDIRKIKLTDSDIGDISAAGLFDAYEPIINEMMSAGEILSDHQAQTKALAGDLIYVRGYEREDGTEVKGHYRHVTR